MGEQEARAKESTNEWETARRETPRTIIPDQQRVEEAIRNNAKRKEVGLDLIPSEMLRLDPRVFAEKLQPLFAAVAEEIRYSMEWQGALLVNVKKTTGVEGADPSTRRGVGLCAHASKISNKTFRAELGGHRARGLFVERAKRLGSSCRVLFLDTKAAFYSVAREVALGHMETEQSLREVCGRLWLDSLQEHPLVEELTASCSGSARRRRARAQADGSEPCSSMAGGQRSSRDRAVPWESVVTKEFEDDAHRTKPQDKAITIRVDMTLTSRTKGISGKVPSNQ